MNLIFASLTLVGAHLAHAQSSSALIPLCDRQHEIYPCRLKESDASDEYADMLFGNHRGFERIRKSAPGLRAHHTHGFKFAEVDVVRLSAKRASVSVTRYEVSLLDCRDTDQCGGRYKWTVIETTKNNGYTSNSRYKNSIDKVVR